MSAYILDDLKPDVKENDILKLDNGSTDILPNDHKGATKC